MKGKWEDNDVITQSFLIAYSQIRDHEDMERDQALLEILCKTAI